MKCKTGFRKPTKYKGYNDLVSLFESRMLQCRSGVSEQPENPAFFCNSGSVVRQMFTLLSFLAYTEPEHCKTDTLKEYNMEQLTRYIKPELMIVTVILYFISVWLKQIQTLKDKYIPFILGAIGIVLCAVWVLATSPLRTGQEVAMAVFTALVQGILVAGLSTYVNQIVKQIGKTE